MRVFKDNAGRAWSLQIHVLAVKRVRAMAGVDLYSLVADRFEGLGKLLADPVQLVDVLYVLCKDDADRLSITDEDFGRGMAGDAIEHASAAFLEELVDFFPEPRVRAGLRKVMEAGRKVRESLLGQLESSLEGIDPEAVARKLIASSGNSRASSESTPIP
jgi:hypothetical protein